MSLPELVSKALRTAGMIADDLVEGVNREVLPVLKETRQRLNELLTMLGNEREPLSILVDTELDENDGFIVVRTPGLTITLPPAVGAGGGGEWVTIRNHYDSGAGDTTIVPAGTDTIEGAASYTLVGDGAFVTLASLADGWIEVG